MPALYVWRTACVIRETVDSVTIVFDTGSDRFEFKAGQFINLTLTIDDKPVSRSYSLSSSPDEDEKPAITVKKIKDGKMSGYMVNRAEEITDWQVDGPHGFFYPNEKAILSKNIVLIGGGSGITPLYSILKYVLKHTTVNVILINANKTGDDVIFGKALGFIESSFSNRFKAWHVFSRSNPEEMISYRNALHTRLSKLVLKKLLKKLLPVNSEQRCFFLCGPPGLIQLAEDTLTDLNTPSSHLYKEYFLPPDETTKEIALPVTVQEVLLHHYEQTNLLEVYPGKTVLEAALQDRIPLNYSCKSGTCGICIGKLTSGKVHMTKNFALREEHLEQGFILLCQSHPLDNEVTIVVEHHI